MGPPKLSADSGIDCSILELSLHKMWNIAKCGNFTLPPVVGYYSTNRTVIRSRKLRVCVCVCVCVCCCFIVLFCVFLVGGGGGGAVLEVCMSFADETKFIIALEKDCSNICQD